MENDILIWSLKAGLILSFLFAGYYFLFRNNTQFQLKRVLLLVVVLAAVGFPLIKITITENTIPTVYAFQQLDKTLLIDSEVIESELPITEIAPIENVPSTFSQTKIIWYVYVLGVIVSFLVILIELAKLTRLIIYGKHELGLGHNVVSHKSIQYPFSFMKWIFIPSDANYDEENWKIIQAHENLHLKQRHTLDILFTSVAQCLLWYHPAVYLIQKSIRSNHEALADSAVLSSIPYHQYSKTLLALSLRTNRLNLGHSFSLISSLSKRLKLMKTQKTTNKKTFISSFIMLCIAVIIGLQTVVYGQVTTIDPQSAKEAGLGNLAPNDIFAIGGDGKRFNSLDIWEKTGNRPDGWIIVNSADSGPLPLVLNEKYKSIIAELESTIDSNSRENTSTIFRLDLNKTKETQIESLFKGKYDFNPYNSDIIIKLTVEERLELYEISKKWAEENITQVYPDYALPKETEVIELKYLIISVLNAPITSERKYSREAVFNIGEVDIKAEPVGGKDRFLRNIAKSIDKDITLNPTDYPDNIEFEFLIDRSGSISMVNLITEIPDDDLKQKQLYAIMKQINNSLIEISTLYGWKPAIKENEPVSSKVRVQIPKALL
jgi:beta-lactamase regulating signal transducer with metallopeptidase domain